MKKIFKLVVCLVLIIAVLNLVDVVHAEIGKALEGNWQHISYPAMRLPATDSKSDDVAVSAYFSETISHTHAWKNGNNIRLFILDCIEKIENLFC